MELKYKIEGSKAYLLAGYKHRIVGKSKNGATVFAKIELPDDFNDISNFYRPTLFIEMLQLEKTLPTLPYSYNATSPIRTNEELHELGKIFMAINDKHIASKFRKSVVAKSAYKMYFLEEFLNLTSDIELEIRMENDYLADVPIIYNSNICLPYVYSFFDLLHILGNVRVANYRCSQQLINIISVDGIKIDTKTLDKLRKAKYPLKEVIAFFEMM